MKKNKVVLPLILFILILTLPLGIYGLINNLNGSADNPNREHYYNGYLYYYGEDNSFLGKYACLTSNCEDVKPLLDEEILEYVPGDVESIGLLNSKMALIQDGDTIKLFNLSTSSNIISFGGVKNYNQNDTNGYLAVKNSTSEKWGIFDTNNTIMILPMNYDYVGYIPNYLTDHFVVKDNDKYYITGMEDKLSIEYSLPIAYYTENEVLLKNANNTYSFVKYDGNYILNNIKKYQVVDNNIVFLTNSNNIYVYNDTLKNQNVFNAVDFEINNNEVIVKLSDDTTRNISITQGGNNE